MTERFIHLPTGLVIALEQDETGWYIASVPALPGCVAQGDSPEEALRDLSAAMEDVLDVIRQDDPSRYEQITATSLSERRWGVVEDANTPLPVFEEESGPGPEIIWRAA